MPDLVTRVLRPPTALCPAVLGFLLLVAGSGAAVAQNMPAELVLRGGKIATMIPQTPFAEALAIRGERIVAVGANADVARWVGPATRVIELDGRFVMPGLIESHGHFTSLGESMMVIDLATAEDWEDVVQRVAAAVESTPRGDWIVGRGWHQGKWKQPPERHVEGYPLHDRLSRYTPEHPVLLTHGTGHMLLANRRAMELAQVDRGTAEVQGGQILRQATGEPTGVFRENAMELIRRVYAEYQAGRSPEAAREVLLQQIRLATQECLRHGITTFQDAGTSLAEVDVFRELADRGELDVRLWVMLNDSDAVLSGKLAEYRTVGRGGNYLTVRAIKRMIDGALGTHGAWLLNPYDDLPGSIGHNTTSLTSLQRTAELARQHQFQLCVHAIGDRANREVLDLFDRLGIDEEHRWRIEHAQHLDPADIERFARIGVIASMQAVHCTSDGPFVVQRLGQRRARWGAYAWRSLLDSGALIANGTDAPVERIDPFACIHASVTRRMASGVDFFPEQRMTRMEALTSYTAHAAFSAFEESIKGSLASGMLADLVVLDRDLTSVPEHDIRETRVLYTIVGGEIKFAAE